MTRERFKMIVEAYGADPRRWPEAERDAALKLAESDADARAMLDEAGALDRAINLADTAPVAPELQARVLASFSTRKPADAWALTRLTAWLPRRPQWIPLAAFAASLLLGLGAGALMPMLAGLDEPPGEAALLALGDLDNALDEEAGGGS